jgi:hypothetical protein
LTGYLPEKRSDIITHWLLFDFLLDIQIKAPPKLPL